jgi:transposase
LFIDGKEAVMRFVGLDVHRDFCEVAIVERGLLRSAGRVATTPESLTLLGQSLGPDAMVVLEATGNAVAIARLLRAGVGRVMLCEPAAVSDRGAAKTDKLDARALARLLASGFLTEVWTPDDDTAALRHQLSRRRQLIKQRTREKNQIHAVLIRNLKPRPPMSDLFGVKGRAWLAEQELPAHERAMVDACLRHLDFLDAETLILDRQIAGAVLASEEMRRLLQLPGVSATTAATLWAAIGEITRFPTPRHLVGYFGLNPRVRQSGSEPARHGRISKHGPGAVRAVLVEAAWVAARTPGPLRAFWERTAAKRGSKIATVALARKLVVLAWQLLTKHEDYAFNRPAALAGKLRTLELLAGAERRRGRREGARVKITPQQRELDKQLARRAELAYRRLVADWQASGPKVGAGATPGRASSRPSKRQAARQTSKPQRSAL